MTKPVTYYTQGYTCAEAMIKSYNEEHKTNIPVSLGSGLGSGMSAGGVCGAVNAAVLVIGYLKGREDTMQYNDASEYTQRFVNKVRDIYNSEICKDLKNNRVSCNEIIDFSYYALNDLLNN